MRTIKLNLGAALLILAFVNGNAFAQRGEKLALPPGDYFHNQQFAIVKYDNITEITERIENATGSIYLNDEWATGTLYTSSGHVLQDSQLKYDIKHDVMEINTPDGVKVLQGRYIKQFELQEANQKALYVSGSDNDVATGLHTAFYKVLASAKDLKLLSRTELHLKQSNYSPQFDVGSKTDKLVKKEKLYIAQGNNLTKLEKDSFSVFGGKADKVKAYAKDKKLKLQKKEDAIQLLRFYAKLK
ncbi:hypothetical protein H8S95_07135 [Pontibacter sp. KCTC 32443]|uniref:hypothetical protein n=1 Tax=Pontibacter TaxID=323449 RepID=UPI00164D2059|nr:MULTISPECIES: hypothetical protein [Pontibacter]MBC5773831.1 hypothetical protein [Pontibacter sp. KCTC 32443]